jgi:hypothetical protein
MRRAAVPLIFLLAGASACSSGGAAAPPTGRGTVAESTFAWPLPERGQALEVEVLNGAGTPGLAKAVTRTLRRRGFDVVLFTSTTERTEATRILLRRGDRSGAERVRQALGYGIVTEQRDATRRVDVTVVLGADATAPR